MNLTSRFKALLGGPRAGPGPEKGTAEVPAERIHPHVVGVVERLQAQGFTALLVGGAVRDLLLGRKPKDFDLATDARPEEVKRLFRPSSRSGMEITVRGSAPQKSSMGALPPGSHPQGSTP